MARYALVADGVVVNVILLDQPTDITPPNGHTLVLANDDVSPGWEYDGNDFTNPNPPQEPEPPEPGTVPPRLVASALSIVVDNGDVAAVEGSYNLVGAAYMDVGTYLVLFMTEQPDTEYYVQINGGAPCMEITDKGTDYIIVTAKDAVGGAAVDPSQFGVQVYRF